MKILVYLVAIFFLILIFYQDYKYRAVSWILFPGLVVIFFCLNVFEYSVKEILTNTFVNFLFVLFLFSVMTIYFSIKLGRIVNLSNGFIGWGDILFIFSLGILFSPFNFIMFYSFSMLSIVTGVLFSRWLFNHTSKQIPLAGLQAMLLLILLTVHMFYPFTGLCNDEWILNVMM